MHLTRWIRRYPWQKKQGDKLNQARVMGKKGVILLEADQLEAARSCLEEVLTLSEELDNKELKADALSNLGLVSTNSGDPGTGLLKQQEATIIARETGSQFLDNDPSWFVGPCLYPVGKYGGSRKSLYRSLEDCQGN